jgi:hypothetical protein
MEINMNERGKRATQNEVEPELGLIENLLNEYLPKKTAQCLALKLLQNLLIILVNIRLFEIMDY